MISRVKRPDLGIGARSQGPQCFPEFRAAQTAIADGVLPVLELSAETQFAVLGVWAVRIWMLPCHDPGYDCTCNCKKYGELQCLTYLHRQGRLVRNGPDLHLQWLWARMRVGGSNPKNQTAKASLTSAKFDPINFMSRRADMH
ncbi:unnamed protein product [Symbiodinium natans]|uniref:Uncharacterized protein n=1 Tax=Symbiodinium natans TaxID=878477 RepID=A0A812ILB9_9DINO|nr:unnamed protein product [Symbiodinium natans]